MARKKRQDLIIGIDEVGRGPLAGPVTAAALMMPKNLRIRRLTKGLRLKDSKKLSAQQREQWLVFIKKKKISFAIASVSPKMIDKINVSRAANLAASRALEKLIASHKIANCKIYLDGGLFLLKSLNPKSYILNSRTIVKGDEKRNCIKLASIAAKVMRDRYMIRMNKKYPQYGFYRHKGYGTKKHIRAIKKHGPCEIHRLTFLRKYLKLKKNLGFRN